MNKVKERLIDMVILGNFKEATEAATKLLKFNEIGKLNLKDSELETIFKKLREIISLKIGAGNDDRILEASDLLLEYRQYFASMETENEKVD